MKTGPELFTEWVKEVGGAAQARAILGRKSVSGIYHLMTGERGIRRGTAEKVERASAGRYRAIDLVFGQQRERA